MNVGQGKPVLCMYCNMYNISLYIISYHFATNQVSNCFVFNQKIHSSNVIICMGNEEICFTSAK